MKRILGLDLGTNSIGWALVEQDFDTKKGQILGMGTRVIPMSQDIIGDFNKGNSKSQTAERTRLRMARRLKERYLLRRERLHRVLNVLGFLPDHFSAQIDFEQRLGQFKEGLEPKLAFKGRDFLFKRSFAEMIEDFKQHQPDLIANAKKLPYDWTIYFLRKKALTKKIDKEELAWILLHFNQKRGYYQLRGEEETEDDKGKSFEILKVKEVVDSGETIKGKDIKLYDVYFENGWKYDKQIAKPEDWENRSKEFIVTTSTTKGGDIKRTFKTVDSEKDWIAIKQKTEQTINQSGKTVGEYIYDSLLQNPAQKIKGKLVRTIERKFYLNELTTILKKQSEFHPELQSEQLFADCIRELYRSNEARRHNLSGRDFIHLFVEDIIFYQRPLKSKKSLILNCALESRNYTDQDGNQHSRPIKAIPKSHPLYQEFRVWKWIQDLNVYLKDGDVSVKGQFLSTIEDYGKLFDFLNKRKDIKQEALLKFLVEMSGLKGKAASQEAARYRWNYVEDKSYPCNETRHLIASRLDMVSNLPEGFHTLENEKALWHIIYSISDKKQYESALSSFAAKHGLDEISFGEGFGKIPPFESDYGTYSEKAIKKLLSVMRTGKYWSWDAIDEGTRNRIDKIINGEFDEKIKERVRKWAKLFTEREHFQALPDWLAKYVVYDRHAEAANIERWETPDDLAKYLDEFRQHSLRNPIVEQVITETLRVVHDIWNHYGKGAKKFFDEIHVELGRQMKNTSDERKRLSTNISENENTNLRLKAMLAELKGFGEVENVRPYSPSQLEILKIYEEGALNSDEEIPDEILKISKTAQPSSSELKRYKLWMEQKYRSPYTGETIPLNRLFTTDYEIEHIIPQSLYFDDSLSNKVICEAAVNKLKDNQLGMEFIANHHGETVEIGFGKRVRILGVQEYTDFVNKHYARNQGKRRKLLMEEIPDKMIERQLNDTRYISKFVSGLLSNIVRAESQDDGPNSKNLVPGNGKITSELKRDWGLDAVWNELILPRFERMNEITQSNAFTAYNERYQKYLPTVPLEFAKGFQKKRIDHRHHAMDALVIACATRDHVNLLNNQHAKSETKRYDLQRKLRRIERVTYQHIRTGEDITREVPKDFLKPWATFTEDAKSKLETIVVSFKQNQRVINKASNRYEKWISQDGVKVKAKVQQSKGDNWAIRKSMHQDTVAGEVNLFVTKVVRLSVALENWRNITLKPVRKKVNELVRLNYDGKLLLKYFKDRDYKLDGLDVSKVPIRVCEMDANGRPLNVASRVTLDDSFDSDKISTITDTGIQKILLKHLEKYQEKRRAKFWNDPIWPFVQRVLRK
jgi:CRISPR-associated endonuclease Csn1